MKRDKHDAIFSLVIREAYKWTCCRCGKYFPEGSRQGIHCSHIFSRRHQSVRFDPNNAVAHCYPCHKWFGGNPIAAARWAGEYLGAGLLDLVEEKMRMTRKWTKAEKAEMYKHYKAEYERIRSLRMAGDNGIIQVIGYE